MLSCNNVQRWSVCPGAGHIDDQPDQRTESAIISELIKSRWGLVEAPVDATDEMIEAIDLFINTVYSDPENKSTSAYVLPELTWKGVSVTPTAYIILDNTVRVYRFEWGHKFVDHFENLAMVLSVAAIVEAHKLDDPICEMFTVQPRCYGEDHCRRWIRLFSELNSFVENLKHAISQVKENEFNRVAGSHCQKCKEMLNCRANERAVQNAISVAYTQYVEPDSSRVALEYDIIKEAQEVLKNRMTAIESRVIHGKDMPAGFARGKSRGTVKWKDESQAEAMAQMQGIDIKKKQELITPNQAKQKGMPEVMVTQLSERIQKTTIQRVTPRHIREALNQ